MTKKEYLLACGWESPPEYFTLGSHRWKDPVTGELLTADRLDRAVEIQVERDKARFGFVVEYEEEKAWLRSRAQGESSGR